MASTKKTAKRSKKVQQELVVDQTARFDVGEVVVISTDKGPVPATVTNIITNVFGILYQVDYVPLWEKHGKSYATVVSGKAVRGENSGQNAN